MTILLVQTFLLLLGAFLLGASLACVIRRAISGHDEVAVAGGPALTGVAVPPSPPQLQPQPVSVPKSVDTDRFGRALAGGHGPVVPPVFQAGQPVVEVQPPPPAPVVVTAPEAPPPAPPAPVASVSEPAPEPPAPPAPEPQRLPVPPANPERSFSSAPPADPTPSYTAVAVAAAAAAAAAAAEKARADAEAAAAEAEAAGAAADDEALASDEAQAFSLSETPVDAGLPTARADDLTRIRSIDSALKERLNRLGVHTFAAIAAWSASDVNQINQSLGFQGRVEQENWIVQAQILAKGTDTDDVRRRADGAPLDVAVPVDGDRLHRIIGVDPASEALLHSHGVVRLADIAAWGAEDVARFEGLLEAPGRITRENWVEQARYLTRGAAAAEAAQALEEAAALEPAADPEPEPAPQPESSPDAGAVSQIAAAAGAVAAAAAAAAAAVVAPAREPPATGSRSEGYAGLRSVRSEALRGDGSGLATPVTGEVEDLKRIRGIGVLIEKKLNSLGIATYEQVANWTGADIDRISQLLDFKGRIERENWIEQARILASGGQTEFSRRADRGDV